MLTKKQMKILNNKPSECHLKNLLKLEQSRNLLPTKIKGIEPKDLHGFKIYQDYGSINSQKSIKLGFFSELEVVSIATHPITKKHSLKAIGTHKGKRISLTLIK